MVVIAHAGFEARGASRGKVFVERGSVAATCRQRCVNAW